MADPPFDISHLHQGEQNRIRNGDLNLHEREVLARGEDPWARFRGPDKGTPRSLLEDWKSAQPKINKFKEDEREAREIRELLKGGATARPPKESESSTPPEDPLAPGSLHSKLSAIAAYMVRFSAAMSPAPSQEPDSNNSPKPVGDTAETETPDIESPTAPASDDAASGPQTIVANPNSWEHLLSSGQRAKLEAEYEQKLQGASQANRSPIMARFLEKARRYRQACKEMLAYVWHPQQFLALVFGVPALGAVAMTDGYHTGKEILYLIVIGLLAAKVIHDHWGHQLRKEIAVLFICGGVLILGGLIGWTEYQRRFSKNDLVPLKQRTLTLSNEIMDFYGNRKRDAPRAPDFVRGKEQQWEVYQEKSRVYTDETMRLYQMRFTSRVNATLTEFKLAGVDTSRVQFVAEHPTNPLGIEWVGTQLGALAGRLPD